MIFFSANSFSPSAGSKESTGDTPPYGDTAVYFSLCAFRNGDFSGKRLRAITNDNGVLILDVGF
jgi:hypothetical protein